MERGLFDQVSGLLIRPRGIKVASLNPFQALRCFRNAQNTQKGLWAQACIAEQNGRESRAKGDRVELRSHFKSAGDLFLSIGMKDRAAHCLENSGHFADAAGKIIILSFDTFLTYSCRNIFREKEIRESCWTI